MFIHFVYREREGGLGEGGKREVEGGERGVEGGEREVEGGREG